MNDDLNEVLENELAEESTELYEHIRMTVDPGQQPERIDTFLTNHLSNISRNRVQNAAKAGNILVNDKVVKQNYKVKPNDVISIVFTYPPRETDIKPEPIPLNIVYEDDDVIVINKQAGLVVHPGHGNFEHTLLHGLAYYFEQTHQNIENRFGYLVHRIDKDTTGLMIVAKNEAAQAVLAHQFFEHSIHRRYYALVWGDFTEDEGVIEGNIGRSANDRRKMTVYPDGDHGKDAITHWKVLERFGYDKDRYLVRRPTKARELVEDISAFKGVIAARFHANIIATSLSVPSVALVWNVKMRGFSELVGCPERYIEDRDKLLDAAYLLDTLEEAMRTGYDQARIAEAKNKAYRTLKNVVLDGSPFQWYFRIMNSIRKESVFK